MEQIIEAAVRHLIVDTIGRYVPARVLRLLLAVASVLLAAWGVSLLVLPPATDLAFGIGAIALALLVLGAAVILGAPSRGIVARTIEVSGNSRPAFVAEFSRVKAGINGVVVAMAATGLGAISVLAGRDEPDFWWGALLLGALALVCAGGAVSALLLAARGGYVALLREGIRVRGGIDTSFVPWSAVTAVGADDSDQRSRHAFVRYADGAGLELSPLTRLLRLPARRATGELRFAHNQLRVPHDELARVLAYFHANPDQRTRIGSPDALVAARTSSRVRDARSSLA